MQSIINNIHLYILHPSIQVIRLYCVKSKHKKELKIQCKYIIYSIKVLSTLIRIGIHIYLCCTELFLKSSIKTELIIIFKIYFINNFLYSYLNIFKRIVIKRTINVNIYHIP